jgi:hypothetical protein
VKYLLPLLTGTLLLVSAAHRAFAQGDAPLGARANGLGGTAVTLTDMWAISNNVAGLAGADKREIGVFAENRFGIKAFNTGAFAAAWPISKLGTAGLDATRFGDDLYSRTRVGVGLGKKLGFVSLGLKVNMIQTSIQELGSDQAVSVDFGGQVDLMKKLVFGAHIFNINQAKMAEYQDERYPTVMKAGLSYRPFERLMVNLEAEKELDYKAEVKAGIEYFLMEKVAVRTGFNTRTQRANFGAGVYFKSFKLDYALGSSNTLGLSNHLSLSWQLPGKTDE